jgi:hypothetical protein
LNKFKLIMLNRTLPIPSVQRIISNTNYYPSSPEDGDDIELSENDDLSIATTLSEEEKADSSDPESAPIRHRQTEAAYMEETKAAVVADNDTIAEGNL